MFLALLFLIHQIGLSLYRVIATAARQIVVANAGGMLLLLCIFLMNGFVIRRQYIHPWVIWYAPPALPDAHAAAACACMPSQLVPVLYICACLHVQHDAK